MGLAKIFRFNTSEDAKPIDKSSAIETLWQALKPIQKSRKSYIELTGIGDILKKTLKEQGQHLESFGQAFQKLVEGSTEIATTSHSVLEQAEVALTKTSEGKVSISELQAICQQLSAEQKELVKLIEVMTSIRETTTLINDIVFQTKLLSFNAAVEAARAGEHGKGFAVVAHEIKKLAESSREAADSISTKIEGGITSVDRMVKVLSHGITQLVESTATTSEKFNSINENVTGLTTSVREISIAVDTQSTSLHENLTTLQRFSELNDRNGSFSVLSIAGISSELATAVEDTSTTFQSELKLLQAEPTETSQFLRSVDQILFQIQNKKDLHSALTVVATEISKISPWEVAHVLVPNEDNVMVTAGIWSNMSSEIRRSNFCSMSAKAEFAIGKGLPGRVYQSKKFEYIENVVVDTNFPRHKAADEIKLVSGMGFPILSRDNRVLAVIEFFAFSQIEPEPQLVESLLQIGQVVGIKSV